MSVVHLLQRVFVTRADVSQLRTQRALISQLRRLGFSPDGDNNLEPSTLSHVLGDQRKNVLFFGVGGTAFDAERRDAALAAIYIDLGEYDLQAAHDVISRIKKIADIDFEGFAECGITGESVVPTDDTENNISPTVSAGSLRPVRLFSGSQSEFFAELSIFAIGTPATNQADAWHDNPFVFESPIRSNVVTRRRLPTSTRSHSGIDSAISLGEGILVWPKKERVTDRYGLIELMEEDDEEADGVPLNLTGVVGKKGSLIAQIIATRPHHHVGDWFRHIFPTQPDEGEFITLGTGTCFAGDGHNVGLEPGDGREIDWLEPAALYRCHSQTVRLFFAPSDNEL